MVQYDKMTKFRFIPVVFFILINLNILYAQISDKRLCVDVECKEPVSLAKTLLRYSSPDTRILSFAPNADVTIYSKSAGSKADLWGAEINGKRGYVPKHMIRETKIFKKPTHLVDTEADKQEVQVPLEDLKPNKVQEAHEVVDGTTIYLNQEEFTTEAPFIEAAVVTPETVTPGLEELIIQDVEENSTEALTETTTETIENSKSGDLLSTLTGWLDGDGDDEDEEDEEDDDEDDNMEEIDASQNSTVVEETLDTLNAKDQDYEDQKLKEIKKSDEKSEETPNTETSEEQKDAIMSEPRVEIPSEEVINDVQKEVLESDPAVDDNSTYTAQLLDVQEVASQAAASDEIQKEEIAESVKIANEDFEIPVENITEEQVTTPLPDLVADLPIYDEVKVESNTPTPDSTEAPEPAVKPVTEPEPIIETITEAESIVEMSTETQPIIETSTETQPIIETSTEARPIIEINAEVEPMLGAVAAAEPETETSTEAELILEPEPAKEVPVEQKSTESPEYSYGEEAINLASAISDSAVDTFSNQEAGNENISTESHEEQEQISSVNENNSNHETSDESPGIFSSVFSFFSSPAEDQVETVSENIDVVSSNELPLTYARETQSYEHTENKNVEQDGSSEENGWKDMISLATINSDFFLYLITTAVSVIIFLFGYMSLDKGRKEGPLIAKINKLEKELLVALKENEVLSERKPSESVFSQDVVQSEIVESLHQQLSEVEGAKGLLEEQVQMLEKELENSTEVGMELNRMLTELLNSQGSNDLKSTVESLQRQLIEQQATVNSVNKTLMVTNTENHELKLEVELSNKKVVDLQKELDKMCLNILKIESEKDQQQSTLESQVNKYREEYDKVSVMLKQLEAQHANEVKSFRSQLSQVERSLELKNEEFTIITNALNDLKALKNNDVSLKSILDFGETKAELKVLKSENQKYLQLLQKEQEEKGALEKQIQGSCQDVKSLREKYDEADRLRVETQTKLDVLSTYFKEKEAQLQKEINKHESMWMERKGEANSATEQIKFLQDQLQNYKTQTENLKQEIISQEVDLKSQISLLEKKTHESWINTRQLERKLDDINQEAAQLRHRLTLSERSLFEEREKNRMQSPIIDPNGDGTVPSLNADSTLLFGTREITKSPSVPPHFLPPPGMPFIPPPFHGVPPFIPPPPSLFPADHRPPPLGRMSSPPINSRYSPSSRSYYDRSSSPSESEYGTSPAHLRRIPSPYNNKSEDSSREYHQRSFNRSRHTKGSASSASGNSTESLNAPDRQRSQV